MYPLIFGNLVPSEMKSEPIRCSSSEEGLSD